MIEYLLQHSIRDEHMAEIEPEKAEPERADKTPKDGDGTIAIPTKDALDVLRIQVLELQKKELLEWAKNRFWLITVISLIVGLLGGYTLIKATIRELLDKEIDSAKKEMQTASFEARNAGAASASIIKQAQTYGTTVDGLQKRAGEVDTQLIAAQQRIQAETSSIKALTKQELNAIVARLSSLETLVTNLSRESKDNKQLVAKYEAAILALKATSESELKRFTENANYNATVLFVAQTEKLAREVTGRLTQAGFKTSSLSISASGENVVVDTKSNSITYGIDTREKAKEIQELLAPLVQIKETRELKTFPFVELGKSTFPMVFTLPPKNTIRIILIDNK